MDKLDDKDGFTSFPLSYTLPNSPTSPEDGTFSILPRYLLQKVRNTFATSPLGEAPPVKGRQAGASPGVGTNAPFSVARDRNMHRRMESPAASRRQPQLASIREGSAPSSVVSRAPRLSTLSNVKRAALPVLSRPSLTNASPAGLSRSQSSILGTLPESPLDHSPPPLYSAKAAPPSVSASHTTAPGFPPGKDLDEDARSVVSSAGGTQMGVAQIFKRLRGDGLTARDYWMADEAAVECYDCNTSFTTWRRKHHCRICGRIFCSKCAWNIIPGAQFGYEGLVRVCNGCVAKLLHRAKEEQAHGRQQSSSNRPSLPASGSVANLRISLPFESMSGASHAHLSNSMQFPRNGSSSWNLAANMSSDNLSQFGGRGRRYSDASMMRPETPDLFEESVSPRPSHHALGSPLNLGAPSAGAKDDHLPLVTPAPFRKTLAEEDRALPSPQPVDESSRPVSPIGSLTGINADRTGLGIYDFATPAPSEAAHYQMTLGTNEDSYEDSVTGRHTNSSGRPETPSAMTGLGPTSYPHAIRSRLASRAAEQTFELSDVDEQRLTDTEYLGNLARSQSRNSPMYSDIIVVEAAVAHTRALLIQCLKHAKVEKWEAWEKVLTPILWKIANYPMPKVQEGDSMDVRQIVKIKRVPGGIPADSEYVSGAVFTKGLLSKSLPRYISNPRVMLFDYPFQFEHDDKKMVRLEIIKEPEQDSLRKLVNSIVQHRPHVVLVGKSISGLALEYLHKANIVVARNVKASVLKSVARCTQAGIFNTYQHFPEATRLGKCQTFRVETFVHALIPGKRKTLMRFEGCSKELGATVILRGGDMVTLTKVKKVTQFMALAVYSLRLEKALLWDEQATISSPTDLVRLREMDDDLEEEEETTVPTQAETNQRETAQLVARALRPYVTTILSTSPTVFFPPPHSLARLREDNLKIKHLQSHHRQEPTITHFSDHQHVRQDSLAAPSVLSRGGEPEGALQTSQALTRSLSEVSLLSVQPQVRNKAVRISAELAEASQIAEAETRRDEHLKIWETRLARHQDELHPVSHQHITILKTIVNSYNRICDGPKISRHHYYRPPTDLTLRQWIVKFCTQAPKCVNKACDQLSTHHLTVYAHGNRKLEVQLLRISVFPTHRQHNDEDIEICSSCTVCGVRTSKTTLSEEASNYSFSKYLELSFYSDELFCRSGCMHNIHLDHVRQISYKTSEIMLRMSSLDVSDVAFPPLRIRVDAWTQLRIKNEEYRSIQKAANSYWESVIRRIENFRDDVLPFERKEAGMQAMHELAQLAREGRDSFAQLLDKTYEEAPVHKPSIMNAPRVKLQADAQEWDKKFHNFETQFIPTDAERARRATSTQLRRLFSDPNTSAPSSPDLRSAFSPFPSVPPSPSLTPMSPPLPNLPLLPPAARGAQTSHLVSSLYMPTSTSDWGNSLSGSDSVAISPIVDSPALAATIGGLDLSVPSLQLTEANMAQLSQEQGVSLPGSTISPPSIIDHEEHPHRDVQSKSNTAGEHDGRSDDSDSTVCAVPVVRTVPQLDHSDYSRSESDDADASLAMRPFKLRKTKPVPSIANLVQRFEQSGMIMQSGQPGGIPALLSPADSVTSGLTSRPSVRRLRSDHTEVNSQRARQSSRELAIQVLSDGDAPPVSAPLRAPRFPKSPSKLSRPKSPSNSSKQRSTLGRTVSSDSALLDVPVDRPPLLTRDSTASSSRSTVHGRSSRRGSQERETRDGNESLALTKSKFRIATKPSERNQKAPMPRPSPMFAPKTSRKLPPTSINISGQNRVSAMARHYNLISKEAEKERHKQMALARAHRARPVAVSRATADVFMTAKEALREDSEEESSSSGADDEMEGEVDEDANTAVRTRQPVDSEVAGLRNRIASAATDDTYMCNPLAASPRFPKVSPIPNGVQPAAGEESRDSDTLETGASTDSSLSVPTSPLLSADSSTMARFANMSESEMGSTGTSMSQTSILKTLSSLWNYRGAGFTPLEQPHGGTIHLGPESSTPIREDEPSSIITYALLTPAYRIRLAEHVAARAKLSSGQAKFMPEERPGHGAHRGSNWELVEYPADAVSNPEEAPKPPLDSFINVDWEANDHFKCKVTVFFAEQFDALRRNCKCEEQFIESLMRCAKWDAIGGKSGAAFLKTKDDRFIIKEVSKLEMDYLVKDWAPMYFEYMGRAYFQELPTVLAKILGVYRLQYKNSEKGRSKKMNVMVMENIYYNKIISKQFDLKGSVRNRLVDETNDRNCVLLDENLINLGHDTPLYVREHTKKQLETALHNDSLFLAKADIMDYSLIVGIDKTSLEIVVGIVDFLRSYTWDKKIESFVKASTYMGAGVQEPTVLNPRMYKNRFREAMSRYFILVPDRWTSAEAFQANQQIISAPIAALTTKGKAFQAVAEEQQEQYAGGTVRPNSPTQSRPLFTMFTGL